MNGNLIANGRAWITATLNAWRARRRLADEFATWGPAETARTLRDVGLSVEQLPNVIRRHPDNNDLLVRLMAVLGIDRTALARHQPERLRDLEMVCTSCRTWKRCGRELARGTARRSFGSFCPNGRELKTIRAVRPS